MWFHWAGIVGFSRFFCGFWPQIVKSTNPEEAARTATYRRGPPRLRRPRRPLRRPRGAPGQATTCPPQGPASRHKACPRRHPQGRSRAGPGRPKRERMREKGIMWVWVRVGVQQIKMIAGLLQNEGFIEDPAAKTNRVIQSWPGAQRCPWAVGVTSAPLGMIETDVTAK